MKKLKRWLALVLAVVLVASNAAYSMSSSMKADELDQQSLETVPAEASNEEKAQTEIAAGDADLKVVEQPQAQQQEAVPESTPAETPQTEVPPADVPQEVVYQVILNKSDVDGGAVKAWTTGDKKEVTYDGNNQYKEEVTEGTTFNFEITANEGYEVEQVTDQNSNVQEAVSVNENVYTYELQNVGEDKSIFVLY